MATQQDEIARPARRWRAPSPKKTRTELAAEFAALPVDALADTAQTAAYLNCSEALLGACRTWLQGSDSAAPSRSGFDQAWMRSARKPLGNALERPEKRAERAFSRKRPPHARLRTCIRLRLKARVTSIQSPAAAARPRSENCRNPIACLTIPNTGSTVALRVA
jgi:hypothetical protein